MARDQVEAPNIALDIALDMFSILKIVRYMQPEIRLFFYLSTHKKCAISRTTKISDVAVTVPALQKYEI
jgi:hypothetical protein